MPLWDAPYCLQVCQDLARRPATDQAMPAARWYRFLTDAQPEVYDDLFTRYPELGYSAPVGPLVTADGGKTYSFGVDAAGDPIRPIGHAELYPNLRAVPDDPLEPGVDFIFESGLIRIPGNRTRLFAGGPYARFVAMPDIAIDATHPPLLQPKHARILLCYKALEKWAARPGSGARPKEWRDTYDARLNKFYLEFATAFNMRGSQVGGAYGNRAWWYAADLGQNSLNL
jgi:hypothetical protein